MWEGMRRALSDPYLLNVTLNMLFFTVLTTFLYFQQAAIVDAALAADVPLLLAVSSSVRDDVSETLLRGGFVAAAERVFTDIRRWSVMPKGGHFAALEQPEALVREVREFFRPLR